MYPAPHLIDFPRIGQSDIGYISVLEITKEPIPFEVKRIFWTYHTPDSIVRGRHAHYHTEEVLVAVSGRIIVTTETGDGQVDTFVVEAPHQGVYIPPNVWKTFQYTHTAVQLVFASTFFEESDYIRDYEAFRRYYDKSSFSE